MSDPGPPAREIRSYVRRAGRITRAQRRALDAGWPRFGLAADGPLRPRAVFAREAPLVLEVGFGTGDALLALAAANPHCDYLGIEVHEAGIGQLLRRLASAGLANVRVIRGDAIDVLSRCIDDASLAALLVYFPDPWPKARHHKRRLVRPSFVALAASKLAAGGRLELATDWEDYARQMLEVIDAEPSLVNLAGRGRFAPRPDSRPRTRFETRGERLGHGVWDLLYARR